MEKYIYPAVLVIFSLYPLTSAFDIQIKFVRTDEEAGGDKFYALDFIGLTDKAGYKSEWHNVTTKDGYILSLFRVPPNPAKNNTQNKGPFYLQAALGGTGDLWVLFGQNRSLVYSLSDAGYDVWIGNLRGTYYSRGHTNMSAHDKKYWDFSLDEYALQDLPAFFDYIINATGQPQLSYVGHSLGSTIILMLLSDKPEYNSKLSVVIHFGTVYEFKRWDITRIYLYLLTEFFKIIVPGGLVKYPIQNKLVPAFIYYFCLINIITKRLCGYPFELALGADREEFDVSEEFVTLMCHYPAGTSSKVFQHYGQLIRSGKFEHFQYSKRTRNREVYGEDQAPEYNVTNIKAPTIIFQGQNDPIANSKNVNNLIDDLSSDIELNHQVIGYDKFDHKDFVVAKDVVNFLYKPMLKILEKFPKSKRLGNN
ncbi:lipase 1 [Fopius arisanus]|uniref:Lipase n=1 Tax=Fopius arisanus TaxID=64838 RepID=A0A9R1U2V1_9HYME|nr:PREDICTED: lipase 1-like [Fopius arisanus]